MISKSGLAVCSSSSILPKMSRSNCFSRSDGKVPRWCCMRSKCITTSCLGGVYQPADLREIVGSLPKHKQIKGEMRTKVFERLRHEEQAEGYIDFITISASVMFSMKYELSIEDIEKQTLYNNIRKNDYPTSEDYLEGLTIESCDYRELYEKYKDEPNVVFIVDPPYLSTDVGTYKMYWRLSDYLDVLNVLKGKPFVYFTSDKSSIIELCEWLGKNKTLGNPFEGCERFEFNAHVNYDAGYKDMMLVKPNAA